MSDCVESRRYASRMTWIKARGPIPEGLHVLHHCDNKLCVNLDHLHLGTHDDNMREAHERGRFQKGSSVGHSKLTEEVVLQVRAFLDEGFCSQQTLADMAGVSQVAISKIHLRKSWSHI